MDARSIRFLTGVPTIDLLQVSLDLTVWTTRGHAGAAELPAVTTLRSADQQRERGYRERARLEFASRSRQRSSSVPLHHDNEAHMSPGKQAGISTAIIAILVFMLCMYVSTQ
jgi:hypothetical protein